MSAAASERPSALRLEPTQRRYELVVERVLELVDAQGLSPGQPLPTERELADLFGVSRNVVRQAFGVLEERGIIRTVRGSGRYLRDQSAQTADEHTGSRASLEVASIADVLEARALVEVEVTVLACERRTAEQANQLLLLSSRLTSWEDNLAFHTAVAAATQNFMLERLVREQAKLAGELHIRDRYTDPDELERMRHEHRAIAEAIMARDAEAARALSRRHLTRTRDLVFESLRPVNRAQSGSTAGDLTKEL
ncbi:FadR/GntR family transcriptional regulator [Nonomuraea sp. CA-141351]|uniref:FadR/GntR family transcriptional regulator n=1 Tax=Nonomuraea sp. CA-141351 TaxID=3239996 RepID=UPI003D8EF6DE